MSTPSTYCVVCSKHIIHIVLDHSLCWMPLILHLLQVALTSKIYRTITVPPPFPHIILANIFQSNDARISTTTPQPSVLFRLKISGLFFFLQLNVCTFIKTTTPAYHGVMSSTRHKQRSGQPDPHRTLLTLRQDHPLHHRMD